MGLRMVLMRWFIVAICALCGSAAQAQDPPGLLTLDAQALARVQALIRAGDAAVLPAYQALQRRAEAALAAPLRSVTHKTRTPPSGDKHDYMSMGPYWWPNPQTADGLPYVRRDGRRNPEVAGDALDYERLQAMISNVRDLALAWRYGGDGRHAQKAAAVLRSWFVDPATRMNPNLQFAQGIPGIVPGRGIGLIDTRDLWWVIDGASLIADSGAFSSAEHAALRRWFVDYVQWMLTSDPGREEAAAYNNHGLYYDVQVVNFLLYTGQVEAARRILLAAQTLRIAGQIDRQGRLPWELERTRPFHYTAFTLDAAARLARYGERVARLPDTWPDGDARCQHLQWRCPLDLWRAKADGRSLAAAVELLARAVRAPQLLAAPTAVEPEPPLATAIPALQMARRVLPGAAIDAALEDLRRRAPQDVSWLLWPPAVPLRPDEPAAR